MGKKKIKNLFPVHPAGVSPILISCSSFCLLNDGLASSCYRVSFLLDWHILFLNKEVFNPKPRIRMIKSGKKVSLEYTVFLNDGTQIDSNVGEDPLVFTLGSNQGVPRFGE